MPTYEYYCSACERDIEVFQSIKDDPLTVCPQCEKKAKIQRKISGGAGIIFKGSGFYETDYKRPPQKAEGSKPEGGDSKPAEPKKTESKPAATAKSSD